MRLISCILISSIFIVLGCNNAIKGNTQKDNVDSSLHCYFFFIADCPASKNNIPKIQQIKDAYSKYGVEMIGIVSDPVLDNEELETTLKEYNTDFKIIIDDSLKIAKQHYATVTPQVLLYDAADNLLYSGAVDNYYYELGRHRKIITEKYLENAIVNTLENKPITTKETKPIGCRINLNFFDE